MAPRVQSSVVKVVVLKRRLLCSGASVDYIAQIVPSIEKIQRSCVLVVSDWVVLAWSQLFFPLVCLRSGAISFDSPCLLLLLFFLQNPWRLPLFSSPVQRINEWLIPFVTSVRGVGIGSGQGFGGGLCWRWAIVLGARRAGVCWVRSLLLGLLLSPLASTSTAAPNGRRWHGETAQRETARDGRAGEWRRKS